ncbi:mitochondrial sodium/calcium exchanger protein [Drosophila suzukii]|uniref:Mitochondrial sodium/calcium exchanger protein n=1 Tax=Drosophila suzukii TaxID=28584 RepID=A0ABM4TKN1_DROSZ
MEFIDLSTVTRCSLPQKLFRNANQTCALARSTHSCGSFVFLINYLDVFFCQFKLPTISIYGVISAFLLMVHFSLLFMLTKYFFVPNLVTLIEFAPMTMFGITFLIFGPSIFVSYYNSAWMICDPQRGSLSPLQFAKMVGDILRYFVIGLMVLSMQGYRAEGVTLWSCMTFILTGMGYLYIVTKKSYQIKLMDTDLNLVKFRVTVFLYTFSLVLLLIVVVSHATFQRSLVKGTSKPENYLDMDSGDEILGKYQKQKVFTRRQLWLKMVNGYDNMKDSHVVYKVLMVPIFFAVSNFFPVISKDRFLIGWNKYINCLCLIVLPLICLPHGFKAVSWLIMLLVCWALSILAFISTHSLRRPDNVWIFAFLGLIISSVAMNLLSREIENVTWQYISIQFDVKPDVTALMYFGLGEMFSEAVVVRCLQQRKMWDATFGVVMSIVTYAIFLAFPLLFYQGCFNSSSSIITTASTETGIHFIFLIVSTSLLHISMSGYEFRISLFYYLLVLTVIYVTLQWMIHYDWMLSLATLHKVKLINKGFI